MTAALAQLVIPVGVFTGIILLLALFVLGARAWLAPSGTVRVVVNGQRTIEADAGTRLLWALARNGIHLPAACGGRGTCGQCRVTVTEGGRELLPTEANHISRRDAARGVRLACMLRLREDLGIEIATTLLAAKRWDCRVWSTRFVAPMLKELVLGLPEGETLEFEAGDYVLLEAPPHDIELDEDRIDAEYVGEWRRVGLLGLRSQTSETAVRAYSLANPPRDNDRAVLVIRFAAPPAHAPPGTPPGRASSYVFGLAQGERVGISGPFGDFHATETDAEMVMIAGGAGIAPIRSIILDQLARGTQRRISFWFGARDLAELCYRDEFDRLADEHDNFSWTAALSEPRVATGWRGATGLIHSVVYDRYLREHPDPGSAEYYLCGPPLMSAAVVNMLEDLGVSRDRIFFDDFGTT